MLVPNAEVCQYQVTPVGDAAPDVSVTPVSEHCGEFDVGVVGIFGNVFDVP